MIEIKNLVKRYGSIYAINGINLRVEDNSFVGLVGPNGSGKTTLLKLIFGFLRPSYGEIKVDGEFPGVRLRMKAAFYSENDSVYQWMRVGSLIKWYSSFFLDWNREKEEELLDFFKIPSRMYVVHLSKGLKAKLRMLLILSRDAKLFLFDEPFSGVDPASREAIAEGILKAYKEGKTFILSTHIVRDVETLFERTIFMKEGNILIDDETDKLREEYGKSVEEIFREIFK
ncbi:MAG: ABC transporter ATP-binding protein [candidate division WOR-3 bacterium]